ncbi:MAG: D-glycero-alpha-D-manno-heptose-1,7-bisphosphate 7-phosphatase [Chloroflexota bacterium]
MPYKIDNSWTLFLDRDGVVNERLPGDYVRSFKNFKFIDGTLEALAIFNHIFGRIIIVSNQQGIGKGLMTREEVESIHHDMIDSIQKSGGRIDKVYYSPFLHSEHHFTRKPSVGMGILAKRELKEISFRKSIMVGDSKSDMLFGRKLGMKTVYIGARDEIQTDYRIINYCFPNLHSFALYLTDSHSF